MRMEFCRYISIGCRGLDLAKGAETKEIAKRIKEERKQNKSIKEGTRNEK
ncbi:hypothetical protein B7P43_G00553 [Cryptotermes secundus]|uniref:Uncharacterized protein n=1 Tax=Cryptotermes secundus TaxID=105785 RepID=A0A2J7QY46_9NEOP|nr:hypothetical protein B7P43_G00553 [Cryptotermes secundus]